MATATTTTGKVHCLKCGKAKITYKCEGCSESFCFDHLTEHRQKLGEQLDEVENERNLFRQILTEEKNDPQRHSLIKQINKWEHKSITKIQQTAKRERELLVTSITTHINKLEIELANLTEQVKQIRQENDVNEVILNEFKQKLTQLKEELGKPPYISVQQASSSFVSKISVIIHDDETKQTKNTYIASAQPKSNKSQGAHGYMADMPTKMNEPEKYKVQSVPFRASLTNLPPNAEWNKNGQTVGGQNPALFDPWGLFVDDDQTVYVADRGNHCIMAWKADEMNGQMVAGGYGKGRSAPQLNCPTDVIVDKEKDSLIICYYGNKRVVRWPRQSGTSGETIASDITCWGVTMDEQRSLYVTDVDKHEVRRYRRDESQGTIVAGANGCGDRLDQLNFPTYIFIDPDHSVFVTDNNNHRVMKWTEGAKEGIVVAGGRGPGNSLSQLRHPTGVLVDQLGTVYVADAYNHRIVRWPKGAHQGNVIVGENGQGSQANQLNYPEGLSFDRHGHLYVVDCGNKRVQRFNVEMPSN